MRRKLLILTAACCLGIAMPADAQSPKEDFVPQGYDFCGWLSFTDGSWTYGTPEPGAFLRLFARNQTCRAARTNYKRTRTGQLPPYAHKRVGYRCRRLDSDYEYSDTRCAKRGKPRVAYRWQTGA